MLAVIDEVQAGTPVMRRPSEVETGGVIDRLEPVPVRYERVRFEGTRFDGLPTMRRSLSFEACEFVACEFRDCEVDAAFCGALAYPESASQFSRTRFVRSRVAGAYLGGARLERCDFVDCDFAGAIWNSVDLVDCTFEASWVASTSPRVVDRSRDRRPSMVRSCRLARTSSPAMTSPALTCAG
jgi:hypothetical protein